MPRIADLLHLCRVCTACLSGTGPFYPSFVFLWCFPAPVPLPRPLFLFSPGAGTTGCASPQFVVPNLQPLGDGEDAEGVTRRETQNRQMHGDRELMELPQGLEEQDTRRDGSQVGEGGVSCAGDENAPKPDRVCWGCTLVRVRKAPGWSL